MIFVSYHTNDPMYALCAKRLKRSLNGAHSHIVCVEPKPGGWTANIHGKAQLMLDVMRQHNTTVCWLDADCALRTNILHVIKGDLSLVRHRPFWLQAYCVRVEASDMGRRFLELWAQYEAIPNRDFISDECTMMLAMVNTQAEYGRAFTGVQFRDAVGFGITHYNVGAASADRNDLAEFRPKHMSLAFKLAVEDNDYSRQWTIDEVFRHD